MALLNRKTIGLMLSAITLTGGVLLFESSQNNRSDDSPTQSALDDGAENLDDLIFSFEETDVEQFSIVRPVVDDEASENAAGEETETLAFEKGESGTWQMTAPQQAVAEEGAIAFLLARITGAVGQTLEINADQLADFGLDQPEATIQLKANGETYELLLGGPDFSGSKRYVRAIAPEDATADLEEGVSTTVYLIGETITGGVERPIEEWLQADESESEAAPAEDSETPDTTEPSSEPEDSEEGS